MIYFLQRAIATQLFCKAHEAASVQRAEDLAGRPLKSLPMLLPALEGDSAELRSTVEDRSYCHLVLER